MWFIIKFVRQEPQVSYQRLEARDRAEAVKLAGQLARAAGEDTSFSVIAEAPEAPAGPSQQE